MKMPVILSWLLLAAVALAQEPAKTKHFGPGISWLQIDYPGDFVMDPKSLDGDAKWWAKFSAPDGSLSIETMSHGYLSDSLHALDGYKDPEDYVLRQLIKGAPTRTRHQGYDRLMRVDAASVLVVYLKHHAAWGRCTQELRFAFPSGSYETHRATIMQVIESAQPGLGNDVEP